MADLGATDTSTTSLGANQFPVSAGYVPNVGLRVTEGGGVYTDTGGKTSAPAVVEDIERPGYIAATSPPSATNAGSDTSYTFSAQVNRVILENHTASTVYYAFDVAASQGSLKLLPGSTLIWPKKVTVMHLWTVAAQNINGSSDGNIVVLGAL